MISIKFFVLGLLGLTFFSCRAQTIKAFSKDEQTYSKLWIDFLEHARLRNDESINFRFVRSSKFDLAAERRYDSLSSLSRLQDSIDVFKELPKYILALDFRSDTKDTMQRFKTIHNQVQNFYEFVHTIGADNIKAEPSRLHKEDGIYNKLAKFQQENSFVFFDKRSPTKILGYIMFIPGEAIKISTPRILSWKLAFTNGKFFFIDLLGQEGLEKILLENWE